MLPRGNTRVLRTATNVCAPQTRNRVRGCATHPTLAGGGRLKAQLRRSQNLYPVIPAQAGILVGFGNRLFLQKLSSSRKDSRLRGNDGRRGWCRVCRPEATHAVSATQRIRTFPQNTETACVAAPHTLP